MSLSRKRKKELVKLQKQASNLWESQPTPRELVGNVARAATALSPRMLVDPRAGARYVSTLAGRILQLQGGVVLRTLLVTVPPDEHEHAPGENVRSIA